MTAGAAKNIENRLIPLPILVIQNDIITGNEITATIEPTNKPHSIDMIVRVIAMTQFG
jgi:hypothetical protein